MDMENNRSPTKEDFLKVRENTGMNRKEFAEHLQIPYRKVQDWELGRRQAPVYVCSMTDIQRAISPKRLKQFGLISMLVYYTERCVTC